ncbi:hypothetical protein CEXT_723091 [Caerostris extrusa]|uniref:Uncharacterized protein n=1 Tax=Caerostris extrusa TaxID=172846 RepID=A0AAV4XFH5_CAEEX|nr:hypothetical protein CEXT_723091 [Caerostris extrusa]
MGIKGSSTLTPLLYSFQEFVLAFLLSKQKDGYPRNALDETLSGNMELPKGIVRKDGYPKNALDENLSGNMELPKRDGYPRNALDETLSGNMEFPKLVNNVGLHFQLELVNVLEFK